ncbi:MAG: hypothetical protein ACXWKH_19845 [Limisphaerales bacterium]
MLTIRQKGEESHEASRRVLHMEPKGSTWNERLTKMSYRCSVPVSVKFAVNIGEIQIAPVNAAATIN